MGFLDLIHSKGETTYTLAKKSGVGIRTIEQYVSGRRNLSNARARIVADLADALGMTVRQLLEECAEEAEPESERSCYNG